MKNMIILTVALLVTIANNLTAKVNTEALDYTYCNWNSSFEYPNKHTFYAGEDVYVKVKPQKHYDINYMEIWVNNQYIRKETSYPYEWCKSGSGDNYLRNLTQATIRLNVRSLINVVAVTISTTTSV
ncbi:MAG: hypothetical protein IPL46_17745 [Saprospiraceae bacterium]|nr:hypothetical protein [Saprospiraceae bacterium]